MAATKKSIGSSTHAQSFGSRRVQQRSRLFPGQAERFFRIDMLPRVDGGSTDRNVALRNRGVQDHFDRRVCEQIVYAHPLDPELFGSSISVFRNRIGAGDDLELRKI